MIKQKLKKLGYVLDEDGFYYVKKLHKYPNVTSNIYIIGDKVITANCDCYVEYIIESKRQFIEYNKIIRKCISEHQNNIERLKNNGKE